MQHTLEPNWNAVLKWVLVLPMFAFTLFVFRVFGSVPVNYLIGPFFEHNLQGRFIAYHIYVDFICMAAAIFASCLLAPSKRVAIAVVYFIFVLVTIPRQLEFARDFYYYGDLPWKTPFLIISLVAGGLVPLITMIIFSIKGKKKTIDQSV